MELTQSQQDLIWCLQYSGLTRDEIIGIMLPVYRSEKLTEELLDFMIDNLKLDIKPNESDVLGKIFEMLEREKIIPPLGAEKDLQHPS